MTVPAPLPPDEAERLAALRRYQILDTAPEPEFDDLARAAGILCNAPIALVSLVDEERQWSKARVGLETSESPREVAFCAHAIVDARRPFVVEDAARDPRFAHNPLVTHEPTIRFYAGAPLVTPDGHAIGTLCVMDRVPHEPTPGQLEVLSLLARQVVAQLELRQRVDELNRTVREQSQSLELADMAIETQELLRAAFEGAAVGMALVGLDGRWLRVNDALCRILGYSRSELLSKTLKDITHPDELQRDLEPMDGLLKGEAVRYGQEKRYVHKQGHVVWVQFEASVLRDAASRPLYFIAQIQDITTAHQAVDALRESEARYRLLFDATPYPAWVYDLRDLRLLAVNEAAAHHYGYSRAEMLGITLHDIVPAEDLPHFAVHLRAGGTGAGRWTWRHRRKDGSLMDVETTSGALLFAGRPAGLCLNNDVTARLRAERRQSAQHAVTHALAESLTLDDAMPKILRVLCQSLLWDFAEFWVVDRESASLRRTATHRVGPELEAFEAAAYSSFRKGTGVPGQIWASGEALWIADLSDDSTFVRASAAAEAGLHSGFGVPVMLTGEVQGVMAFFGRRVEPRDDELLRLFDTIGNQVARFIERDAADRAFRASEARTSSVVENMLEGLIVVDDRASIESVNPAAERMFGYSRWDLIGQHLKILMPQSIAGNADAFLRDAFKRSIGRITEWDGRRKSGEVFRFELSLYEFLTDEGRHFAGHVRDISDRRRLERMKKEFVATVSHELRTPLTSIRGSLSLLAGGALGDLSDEANDVVAIAERNTLRLINLINDILDLERLDAGKMELHIVKVPLSQILQQSIESVRGMADAQAVSLECETSSVEVQGDSDRLVQVLVNLLSNAVKFSPRGGVVRVQARQEGATAEVRVEDQGRGIPASHREAIFQRFQQVEAADSRQKSGTGLGLAISRAIVEQHGGSIGVESAVGKGSTFWFRIPVAGLAEAPHDQLLASIAGQGPGEGGGDVLLADYDEALLGVLARQLLQRGVAVRFATSVPEALRLIQERRPGVLVLDFGLPDGDGRQLLRTLQADHALKHLPLLVYTAHDMTNEDRLNLVLGPTRHLTKARGNEAVFWERVAELLETSRPPEAPV